MLTLSASLVLFSLSRLSVAQFAAYPPCVQPLLTRNFPPSCLSDSLAAQNTCLCKNANAFGSALVTAINRECGCADLEETTQLTTAYCNQVDIDIGPAFSVFIQDDTPCGGSGSGSGSGSSGGSGTSTTPSGSASTGVSGGTSATPSGSTSAGTGGGTSTATAGSTSTSAGTSTNSGNGGSKSSAAHNRIAIEKVVEVFIGITGGMFALQWCLSI